MNHITPLHEVYSGEDQGSEMLPRVFKFAVPLGGALWALILWALL